MKFSFYSRAPLRLRGVFLIIIKRLSSVLSLGALVSWYFGLGPIYQGYLYKVSLLAVISWLLRPFQIPFLAPLVAYSLSFYLKTGLPMPFGPSVPPSSSENRESSESDS